MRRRYSVGQYVEATSFIWSIVPDAAITTDIMVGFPGETEAEFEESYHTCAELGFARIHVFPFSPRPGTEAASLPHPVRQPVKRDRVRRILSLASESTRRYRQSFVKTRRPVLWESRDGAGRWNGFTDNYIPVKTASEADLTNEVQLFTID
jgi:threonylcarbamoyladenosine tRNA methylthiotransferase MtaB